MSVRVRDVIDTPEFRRQIEELDHEYDLREYRHCIERNRPVSKALWRRLLRYRRSRS